MSNNRNIFPLSNLERSPTVTGGLATVYYIPIDHVVSIGNYNPETGTIAYIELVAGKDYFKAHVPVNAKGISETQQESEAGPYMDILVSCVLPFETMNNHRRLNAMKYYRYLVIVETHAGLYRMIGNKERGADFSFRSDSTSSYLEIPGSAIQFSWQSEDNTALYVPSFGSNIGGGGASGGGPA